MNYAETPADTRLMPLSDINDLDAVVHELGIQDSSTTPVEAVRELKAEIAELQTALSDILNTTPEERQNPQIWFVRVDRARALSASPPEQPAAYPSAEADEEHADLLRRLAAVPKEEK